jgi:hypothetical protein
MKIKGKCATFTMSTSKEFTQNKSLLTLICSKEILFTEFSFDDYKYRNVSSETKMYYLKNVCICSSNLFINLSSEYLEINIWDKKLDYPEYDIDFSIKPIELNLQKVYIEPDYEWLNSLLYKKEPVFDSIKEQIKEENFCIEQINAHDRHKNYLFLFEKSLLQRKRYDEIKDKYKNTNINLDDTIQILTKDKYFTHKHVKKYTQSDLCKWIKEESTEQKNIENTQVFRYMRFFLENLTTVFQTELSLSVDMTINYTGIFVSNEYKKVKNVAYLAIIALNDCVIKTPLDLHMNTGDLLIINSYSGITLSEECLLIYIEFVL